jgi:N-ATPase, AtpR subunit
MSDAGLVFTSAWAAAGFGFGVGYFAALRWSVGLYRGGGARLVPVALTLGRIAGAIFFFGLAGRFGALPLLAALLGFLLARSLALRAVRGTA